MASPQRWLLPLPVIHGAAISSISFQILVDLLQLPVRVRKTCNPQKKKRNELF